MFKERWKQRFENFEKAFLLFKESIDEYSKRDFSKLEKEGLIQRFEYTFELAWKTVKDYLEHNGLAANSPREAIKEAFANDILQDGQVWIDMLEDRKLMAHTYDEQRVNYALDRITTKYAMQINELYDYLKNKV